jgi:hypothetical protein
MKLPLYLAALAVLLAGCNQQLPQEKQQALQAEKDRQSASRTPAPAPLSDPNLLRGGSAPAPVAKTPQQRGRTNAPAPLNNPNLLRGG